MIRVVIAALDSPPADRNRADVVCDGRTDVAVLAQAMSQDGAHVELTPGTFDLNAGFTSAGNRYLCPAAGVTVRGGGMAFTRLIAAREPCRIAVDTPGVTLAGFAGIGYIGVQDEADRFTCEEVSLAHSLDVRSYLDFGRKGGGTAAFMVCGRRGRTIRDLTFRCCDASMSCHHGFFLNLAGAAEGGGFADVMYDRCRALSCGSGFEGGGRRDWSCGFDIPDAGDIERMAVSDCLAIDCWQDGFHLDGSWDGHLVIGKRIIDRHGGTVWVESTPGGGSTFSFTLPAA